MLKQDNTSRSLQDSLGSIFAILPISPNSWTALSIILALIAGFEVSRSELSYALALFVFAAFCDLIDGAVARARKQTSAFGGFLDGIADRFVEAIFLFSFMFYPLPIVFGIDPRVWLAGLVFLGTCMPSYVRAYSEHMGVISHEKALALGGIFERSERLIIVALGLAGAIYTTKMEYFIYAVILTSVLSFITILQRIYTIKKEANRTALEAK